MLKPGDTLDHYVVEALVGGGGMARVYRVRHRILDHPMALKVLDPSFVTKARIRKRFLAEGRIMAKVRHPAIVMVTDAVIDAPRGVAGLVMEFVEGPDLARVIARMKGPPSADFVRRIMLPILDGLHHVHQEGVVHRDLKPANVLLSRDAAGNWHPRLTDFGVAWLDEEASARAGSPPKLSGGLVGTPAYMSPEQARASGATPDPRWDVWAAGVVLYELATGGHHPFEQGDQRKTLDAVRKGEYRLPTEIVPDMDPGILSAIDGALRVDPERRAPSAAALSARLAGTSEPARQDPGYALPDAAGAWLESPDGARRIPLTADVVLGRGPNAVVMLRETGVEDAHARITHESAGWILQDLSAGGTYVNGARVHRIQLADGDLLRLGWGSWRVRLGERMPSLPSADTVPPKPPPVAPRPKTLPGARALPDRPGPALLLPDGSTIPIGLRPLVIGRSPAADVHLPDPSVSVRHARVYLQGLDVLVEDLLSANGTWVNGQRARFRRLQEGDRVKIGGVEIVVRM